jgi:DNA-binding NtrC family response regulator
MPNTKANLLIVDDEPSIRMSLGCVLKQLGYRVRAAEDGVSALIEIDEEVPDILLSDLQMPGMSGFELLAAVGCRFPGMRTIAMSGGFSGDKVPSGVSADAFFQKGSGVEKLLRMIETPPQGERMGVDFAIARSADQDLFDAFQPAPAGL